MTIRIVKLAKAMTFGLCALAAACGGGSPETAQSLLAVADDAPSSLRTDGEVETGSAALSDAGMLDPLALFPGIIELRNSDVTGLVLGLTDEAQLSVEIDQLDAIWLDLQDCLDIRAVPPLVVIQDMAVEALSSEDDVLFNFFGQIVASTNDADEGASVQLLADELSGTNLNEVFALRSVLGRYIWRSNDLPESNFDTSCITVSSV